MTVAELIQILQAFPPDAWVVSEGYETGYEPIKKVELVQVKERPNPEWWDGLLEASHAPDARSAVFLNAESKNPQR